VRGLSSLRVDCTHSGHRRGVTAICAKLRLVST
jgi:hypothetical protein